MWENTDGDQLKNIFKNLNKMNLSEDSKELLNIALLTNAHHPQKNISLNEFLNLVDKETEFRELFDKKELYASLNFSVEEELSWW